MEAFQSDPAYRIYLSNLKSAGFFGDESEGSAQWKIREVEAMKGWKAARSSE